MYPIVQQFINNIYHFALWPKTLRLNKKQIVVKYNDQVHLQILVSKQKIYTDRVLNYSQ